MHVTGSTNEVMSHRIPYLYFGNVHQMSRHAIKSKKIELSRHPPVQPPKQLGIGHVQLLQSTPGTILANKSPPEGQARDIWSLGEVRHSGIRFRQAHPKLGSNKTRIFASRCGFLFAVLSRKRRYKFFKDRLAASSKTGR